MSLAHISLGKVVSLAVGAIAAFVVAMDPTWKMFIIGALIASIPPTITGVFALRLQAKNASKLDTIKDQTDGIIGKLTMKADAAGSLADHAAGVQQERVEERARQEVK
jgi:hypothetical protein